MKFLEFEEEERMGHKINSVRGKLEAQEGIKKETKQAVPRGGEAQEGQKKLRNFQKGAERDQSHDI